VAGVKVVSRFLFFPIQMNFAENQKWPYNWVGHGGRCMVAARTMMRAPPPGEASGVWYRVGKSKKVVKRRGFPGPSEVGARRDIVQAVNWWAKVDSSLG
jgi:hypothetical protein